MTFAVKISYAVVACFLAGIIIFRVGHVFLAGLFAFMIMDIFYRQIIRIKKIPKRAARLISATVFSIVAIVLAVVFTRFISQTLLTLPRIIDESLPKLIQLGQRYGITIPFTDFQDLRVMINSRLPSHFMEITKTSTVLTRGVFHTIIGIVAAILFFTAGKTPQYQANLFDAVRKEVNARIFLFMRSFEKVFGAQLIISSINTVLTLMFISALGLPHVGFLTTMTFVIGIIPILGNIITNTVIVVTALGLSVIEATFALLFLMFIHKMEYFLNSKIMGSSINMPMWQMLLALLLGDIVMGVPGILLAPAVLHYIKTELQSIPWKPEQNGFC
ncbi:MAG: AI-2E family transporter [Elusimicrobiaceae bacterium]